MPRNPEHPDPVRVLQLLWRGEETPSPRSGLTTTRVVDAAIALADAEGLRALSMRGVADQLGVGTMSLYTYVPGKGELIPLMVDRTEGDVAPVDGGGWRAGLESIAMGWWTLYRRHPWLLDVPVTRPVLGPNQFDRYEAELTAVDGIGLTEVEMDSTISLVRSHAAAAARRAVEIARDAEDSGVTDDQWWYTVLPTLEQVLAGRNYPVAERVGSTVAAPHTDPEEDLRFGLGRILDGLAQLVAERAGGA